MTTYFRFVIAAFGLVTIVGMPPVAMSAGGLETPPTEPTDPDFAKAQEAVKAKDWNQAVELLNKAAARNDKNADVYNYLGYAERKRGNLDAAFKHYERALTLNPKHRGAHEYIGEAYLMVGNLAKAEEHLAALDNLCFLPCHEYSDLKADIAEYKQKRK